MFTISYIKVVFCFAIISSITATAQIFIDYLSIKTIAKYTNF